MFECPWGVSELSITELTPDLKVAAREMERDMYPEPERPMPARASGRVRRRAEGEDEVLAGECMDGGVRLGLWRARFAAPALSRLIARSV